MTALTLKQLADRVDGRVKGDPDHQISGVSTLQMAGPEHLGFITSNKYRDALASTRAGAVILREDDADSCPTNAIIVDDPLVAYAKIATQLTEAQPHEGGIHPTAVIGERAEIDPTAWVGPHSVVEDDVVLGPEVFVGPGCVIGKESRLGRKTRLIANVTIGHGSLIGERVILHAGAVIGDDGFGNANENGRWIKIPQLGRAIIGNDVEIGCNSTVDRGALEDTVIKDGVRLDNLVHVAHNCEVGEHTAAAALVGVAGSTKIGKRVILGGNTGLNGHIEIADDVFFTAKSMVTKSVQNAGVYSSGIPAEPNAHWRKKIARYRQLDKLVERIQALEAAVQKKKD